MASYRVMTARLCSENLSQEKTPQVCDCVEPSALQLTFGLERLLSLDPDKTLSYSSQAAGDGGVRGDGR